MSMIFLAAHGLQASLMKCKVVEICFLTTLNSWNDQCGEGMILVGLKSQTVGF